ncbi:Pimeloyl-ACP methyl ester carboxylesterase [Amycolatopsis lurida]|uniref:Alpha/beta hydrolase n=1 Tax=Amycolatopsis lurida NRRL 2430 TaxID=1460371 RepID=A0A2P2FPT7_AMYLU|nr:alpha/beta fold hydrolase [Amycolatopsis lurida]KFU78722.1 alpha/beta hydrolase [Amycolatopsis lurida NRRL 2430]SEB32134.1 Pimeloyl-ACP methyl ester carboxylesterase [Amycolatopsis lurida]
MSTQDSHFTVHHDGVAIQVSRGGRGRPLVLCPGLLTTQADLCELIELLRRDHDVVAFDLRGHGLTSAADRYTFEAFLGDFGAVMAESDHHAPLLVGHSLGADLAVHYAADHPDAVSGLVLVDGANPVPEPFLTEADLPEFRAMAEGLRHEFERVAGTARQVLLAPQDFLDLNIEIEAVRSGILDRYREIDCPIHLIMSTSMAGNGDDDRARWRNENWRAGAERLARERPHLSTSWLDAHHRLVVTHAPEIARLIRDAGKATC